MCATMYTLRMLSFPHTGKDSWLEQGLYMLAFYATCLVVLLPWFFGMIFLNWARLDGWRWRVVAAALTLAIMAAVVFGVTSKHSTKTLIFGYDDDGMRS